MLRHVSRLQLVAVSHAPVVEAACRVQGGCTTKRRIGSLIYPRQTPITKAFWAVQKQTVNNLITGRPEAADAADQFDQFDARKLITKTAADSMREFVFCFSKDHALRSQYMDPYGSLHIGNVLEDIDALATVVAYAHCDDGNPRARPLTIVTASCDRIDQLSHIPVISDLRYRGWVSWVGRSSMEVRIEIMRSHSDANLSEDSALVDNFLPHPAEDFAETARCHAKAHEEGWDLVMQCVFTMVARDAFDAAAEVNRLRALTEQQKQWMQQGEENNRLRRLKRERAILPPAPDEVHLIHSIFTERQLQTLHGFSPSATPRGAARPVTWDEVVPMAATETSSVEVAHPQAKNIHGKLFGGFIMRRAFELAWASAHLHARCRPVFRALDDITFLAPVEIGSIMKFDSKVVYVPADSNHRSILVAVLVKVADPLTGVWRVSTRFHCIFDAPHADSGGRQVAPQTYTESLEFLEGKRRWENGRATRHASQAPTKHH